MNVKDVIEVDILSNGMDGEGVARVDGKVLFVPYTLKGERVRVMIRSIKSRYAVGTAIKILAPSAYRVAPSCPHYYNCGGCDMGHIATEYRSTVLLDELKNNLYKIANIDYTPTEFVRSAVGGGVRNKISMPFGVKDGKTALGLYRHNTHNVEAVECGLAGALAKEIAHGVCDHANDAKLSVYDEKTGKGLLRHLVIRQIGDRASATLVINADGFKSENELAKRLPDNVDFFVCPNTRRNNVIMGDTVRLVKGNARLPVDVLGVKAELSPLSFFQVNDSIRDKLYCAAIDEVRSDNLIDLYSGIGITCNLAAKKCNSVTAVECVPQAVSDADRTALNNGNSKKIRNICGSVERVLADINADGNNTDVLVDPPRKGCGASVMEQIARISPNRLIYISCNHATMCRDIKVLTDLVPEYKIRCCRVFDMFPDTHHTEVLIVLSRDAE